MLAAQAMAWQRAAGLSFASCSETRPPFSALDLGQRPGPGCELPRRPTVPKLIGRRTAQDLEAKPGRDRAEADPEVHLAEVEQRLLEPVALAQLR